MENQPNRVKGISALPDQRFKRQMYIRNKMYNETRILLNNCCGKWISIGISPTCPENGTSTIDKFLTEIYLDGEKTSGVRIGGSVGFKQLVQQIRRMERFRNVYTDVS